MPKEEQITEVKRKARWKQEFDIAHVLSGCLPWVYLPSGFSGLVQPCASVPYRSQDF